MKQFTVYGEPKGKGRPRFARNGHTYTPSETVNYETLVKVSYQAQCEGCYDKDKMLCMTVMAYFNVPKSASNKKREAMLAGRIRPTKKPDLDNILKIVADSLNGIAYYDDAQIVGISLRKFYSDVPRTEIIIQDIGGKL